MLKCDQRAFARCPYNKTCVSAEKATFTECSDCDLFNQKILQTPMTNADRIRVMTDEELAEFLSECNAYGERADASQWLPWLQQPAEVE